MAKNAEELAREFTDPDWRVRFSEISDLLEILNDCFISDKYSVPDELNDSIVLTQAGSQINDRLIRKESVPVKEARLMCALTLGHEEPFVDVTKTDIEKLRSSIHDQLQTREIRFPFIWGRELYDAYADMFEDERTELGVEDTQRLFDRIPMGVFQYGVNVLGPYGLLRSNESRAIHSRRSVRAYHCAQVACRVVHGVYLSTSQAAQINDQRTKLHRILDESKVRGSEWWGLSFQFHGVVDAFYDDRDVIPLITVLGDCLDLVELRSLLGDLLDSTKGTVRNVLPKELTGSAESITQALERDQLLQLILLAEEPQIATSLDRLIRSGQIPIALGDTRSPVVNSTNRTGGFHLSGEVGHYGVRFKSDDRGIPALRLRRLLKKLYLREDDSDAAELEWQLRGFDAEDIDERLEDFYRATTPREALRRMILVRKTNVITAAHEVRLDDIESLSDETLIEAVLWKLGFDVHQHEDPHAYFWDLHERLSALTRASRISGSGESERFRGVANSYFTELEGLLADSLAFSTWLLTNDHSSSPFPFQYDDESDRRFGLTSLEVMQEAASVGDQPYEYSGDRIELHDLMIGFGVLGRALGELQSDPSAYTRDKAEYPTYADKTDLKSFVFRHTRPFLDLSPASQRTIRERLKEITRLLERGKVNVVRNDYSHYRRNERDINAMANALEDAASAVRVIENLGFARVACWPTEITSDPWGRRQHNFSGPRSMTHLFARPSSYDWMYLPALSEPQYIVHSAAFAEPNEVLRFTRRYDSPFSRLWEEFPKRRQRGSDSPSASGAIDTPATSATAGPTDGG